MNLIDIKIIGQKIKSLRKSYGLTQLDAAMDLGYSERQYRRIESDGCADLLKLSYIAEYYNVSLLSLLPNDSKSIVVDGQCPSYKDKESALLIA